MIYYQDLIDRGFTRDDGPDPVFKKQHGFDYYVLYRDFGDFFSMDYNILEQTVSVMKVDDEKTILKKIEVSLLEEVDAWIEILEKAKKKRKKLLKKLEKNDKKAWEKGLEEATLTEQDDSYGWIAFTPTTTETYDGSKSECLNSDD